MWTRNFYIMGRACSINARTHTRAHAHTHVLCLMSGDAASFQGILIYMYIHRRMHTHFMHNDSDIHRSKYSCLREPMPICLHACMHACMSYLSAAMLYMCICMYVSPERAYACIYIYVLPERACLQPHFERPCGYVRHAPKPLEHLVQTFCLVDSKHPHMQELVCIYVCVCMHVCVCAFTCVCVYVHHAPQLFWHCAQIFCQA
jgi:hypothetical protein